MDLDLNSMTEFPSVKALKLDFMKKMEKGHVFGCFEQCITPIYDIEF